MDYKSRPLDVLAWSMPQNASKGTPERVKTDSNLHKERLNADTLLAEQRAGVEADADRVVELARVHADAVLLEARDKADELLEKANPDAATLAGIETERVREDDAVAQERATADESVQQERAQNARDLLALLPFERVGTDRSLLTERVRSDIAVDHRDDFLGMVSHDLRDLLGGIVTSSAILLRSVPEGDEGSAIRVGTSRIQRYAARMKRLIDDLTDVASIDAGKLGVTPVRGNLAPVVLEAVVSMRDAAAAKNVSLTLSPIDGPLPAFFDADRVMQVVTNLIANAVKFTPQGGEIHVSAEPRTECMQVSITDTGAGIPADLIEAIFERFRQVAGSDRRGLGLGLYISRSLIEAQRGKIWAESQLGRGTTFRFTLPTTGGVNPQDF
jgi:signal transduction histidine kinase